MVVLVLACVLGESEVIVKIKDSKRVYDLKEKLVREFPDLLTDIQADELDLHLIKQYGTPSQTVEEDVLRPPTKVIRSVFDRPDYGVLVKVSERRARAREEVRNEGGPSGDGPGKRLKGDPLKWQPKEDKHSSSLEIGKMAFVNRERPTEQLLEWHKRNYYRAKDKHGADWIIPLVDNTIGLGKTRFGMEYIGRCEQKWEELDDKNEVEVLGVLRKCHTIFIEFQPGDIYDDTQKIDRKMAQNSIFAYVTRYFAEQYGETPESLSPKALASSSLKTTFRALTNEVGPLFIVLDNIQVTFGVNVDDITKAEQFMKFCSYVLEPLLSISKLFFLVVGCASFLSYVNCRPNQILVMGSPIDFKALSLSLFRPPAIKEVIMKTIVDGKGKTIMQHCSLDDDQVSSVAEHLFRATFGHPRSLLHAFRSCHSYDELLEYRKPVADWKHAGTDLLHYTIPLYIMMETVFKGESYSLQRLWNDNKGNTVSYDQIADMFAIDWEGTTDHATLYMPESVKCMIVASVYFLRNLLARDIPATIQLPDEYAGLFELLVFARLHELFLEGKRPMEVLPSVFTAPQQLSTCTGVLFSDAALWVPIATKLLVMMTTHGRNWTVAVKAYAAKEVGLSTVKAKCEKFNRVCMGSSERLNVLIICATNYSAELKRAFELAGSDGQTTERQSAVYPSDDFADIDEIILVNLSTPQYRAEFFGIQDDAAMQMMLENVLKHARVEHMDP